MRHTFPTPEDAESFPSSCIFVFCRQIRKEVLEAYFVLMLFPSGGQVRRTTEAGTC